ncbi:DUF2304 domain-containing protein [uncultured Microbacterium sp.]|uniref:DUF2304 domain-containing protein n=1 Tax=uncultured Microbacterium sp. TaxID=191216 RepID=UPI00260147B1|nr:DUF2304 domain-containing protein [uncultured Microbacterium sp.]
MTIAALGFGLFVLVLIVVFLMRRQLREKYATLWLVVGLAILVLGVFPGLLGWLAAFLGVAVPSNLLFALALALLVGVALHLSWELSRAEEEIRRVAEEVAILRTQVDSLRLGSPAEEATVERPMGEEPRSSGGSGS